jgi:hypothetical protein
MKRFTILALLGILITTGGCESSTEESREGLLFGWIEGDVWRGTAQAHVYRDTLYIMSQRRNVRSEQWLTIVAAPTPIETYAVVTAGVSTSPSRYEELVGGDVVVYTAAATSGTLTVRESTLDPDNLAGTVELTLQGPRGTWHFTQGEFEAETLDIIP